MQPILKQIQNLNIPYPQKRLLELEVQEDLKQVVSSEGNPCFSDEDLSDLEALHATMAHRWLNQFDLNHRRWIEILSSFVPLTLTTIFIIKEDLMTAFLRDGGTGMYVILGIGLFLLAKEGLNAFRLLLVKDHSAHNLRIDTPSVWLGCLALMCLSIGWTFLGLYVSAQAVAQAHASYDLLLQGAKESITPVILGSLLCALLVLTHYATRQMLVKWQAPIND